MKDGRDSGAPPLPAHVFRQAAASSEAHKHARERSKGQGLGAGGGPGLAAGRAEGWRRPRGERRSMGGTDMPCRVGVGTGIWGGYGCENGYCVWVRA